MGRGRNQNSSSTKLQYKSDCFNEKEPPDDVDDNTQPQSARKTRRSLTISQDHNPKTVIPKTEIGCNKRTQGRLLRRKHIINNTKLSLDEDKTDKLENDVLGVSEEEIKSDISKGSDYDVEIDQNIISVIEIVDKTEKDVNTDDTKSRITCQEPPSLPSNIRTELINSESHDNFRNKSSQIIDFREINASSDQNKLNSADFDDGNVPSTSPISPSITDAQKTSTEDKLEVMRNVDSPTRSEPSPVFDMNSIPKPKVLRTYQNRRKKCETTRQQEEKVVLAPSIESVPDEKSLAIDTMECRRSSRKKIMKYDVRDLFNISKKVNKVLPDNTKTTNDLYPQQKLIQKVSIVDDNSTKNLLGSVKNFQEISLMEECKLEIRRINVKSTSGFGIPEGQTKEYCTQTTKNNEDKIAQCNGKLFAELDIIKCTGNEDGVEQRTTRSGVRKIAVNCMKKAPMRRKTICTSKLDGEEIQVRRSLTNKQKETVSDDLTITKKSDESEGLVELDGKDESSEVDEAILSNLDAAFMRDREIDSPTFEKALNSIVEEKKASKRTIQFQKTDLSDDSDVNLSDLEIISIDSQDAIKENVKVVKRIISNKKDISAEVQEDKIVGLTYNVEEIQASEVITRNFDNKGSNEVIIENFAEDSTNDRNMAIEKVIQNEHTEHFKNDLEPTKSEKIVNANRTLRGAVGKLIKNERGSPKSKIDTNKKLLRKTSEVEAKLNVENDTKTKKDSNELDDIENHYLKKGKKNIEKVAVCSLIEKDITLERSSEIAVEKVDKKETNNPRKDKDNQVEEDLVSGPEIPTNIEIPNKEKNIKISNTIDILEKNLNAKKNLGTSEEEVYVKKNFEAVASTENDIKKNNGLIEIILEESSEQVKSPSNKKEYPSSVCHRENISQNMCSLEIVGDLSKDIEISKDINVEVFANNEKQLNVHTERELVTQDPNKEFISLQAYEKKSTNAINDLTEKEITLPANTALIDVTCKSNKINADNSVEMFSNSTMNEFINIQNRAKSDPESNVSRSEISILESKIGETCQQVPEVKIRWRSKAEVKMMMEDLPENSKRKTRNKNNSTDNLHLTNNDVSNTVITHLEDIFGDQIVAADYELLNKTLPNFNKEGSQSKTIEQKVNRRDKNNTKKPRRFRNLNSMEEDVQELKRTEQSTGIDNTTIESSVFKSIGTKENSKADFSKENSVNNKSLNQRQNKVAKFLSENVPEKYVDKSMNCGESIFELSKTEKVQPIHLELSNEVIESPIIPSEGAPVRLSPQDLNKMDNSTKVVSEKVVMSFKTTEPSTLTKSILPPWEEDLDADLLFNSDMKNLKNVTPENEEKIIYSDHDQNKEMQSVIASQEITLEASTSKDNEKVINQIPLSKSIYGNNTIEEEMNNYLKSKNKKIDNLKSDKDSEVNHLINSSVEWKEIACQNMNVIKADNLERFDNKYLDSSKVLEKQTQASLVETISSTTPQVELYLNKSGNKLPKFNTGSELMEKQLANKDVKSENDNKNAELREVQETEISITESTSKKKKTIKTQSLLDNTKTPKDTKRSTKGKKNFSKPNDIKESLKKLVQMASKVENIKIPKELKELTSSKTTKKRSKEEKEDSKGNATLESSITNNQSPTEILSQLLNTGNSEESTSKTEEQTSNLIKLFSTITEQNDPTSAQEDNANRRRSDRIKTQAKPQSVGRGLVRDGFKPINDRNQNISNTLDLEAQNAKFLKDMEERLSQFQVIKENEYRCERIVSKEAKKMICDCFLTRDEEDRGELGCGEDCLNRLLMIECGAKCNVGERCTNRRFQRNLYAPCKVFRTEKKGFGIMADAEVHAGEFIMEYVGEVLNGKQFEKRANVYSQDKNKHYYFMALRSDSIIDATGKGNISRFINHSCDPNAETQKWTVNGELRIGFFSKKRIRPGEEITFDYQFQRYGKEAQKCFCESVNCRGWIGEEPESDEEDEELVESESEEETEKPIEQEASSTLPRTEEENINKNLKNDQTLERPSTGGIPCEEEGKTEEIAPCIDDRPQIPKSKKTAEEKFERLARKLQIKREKIQNKLMTLEDPDLEEEIVSLTRSGLKNQAHTLKLSRLMVRAKLLQTRIRLLQILSKGEMPCKRLFLDYHGLRLLHGWMNETETENIKEDLEFRLLIGKTLEILPIPNKTMLKESKVFQTIQNWSNDIEPGTSTKDSPTDTASATTSQSDPNSIKTDPNGTYNFIRANIKHIALKLVTAWEILPEVFRIPKRERIEQMKEHEREADRQYKALNPADDYHDNFQNLKRNKERFGTKKIYKWTREKFDKNQKENISEKLNTDSSLSKLQRRQLFAAKVAKDEAEKRLAEIRREFEIKCRFYGLDPKQINPRDVPFCVNPATGQWYTADKRKISTPSSHAHIRVPPKPKSTDPNDYKLPPMDLPPLWKFAMDTNGRLYYYHIKIRIPQWEPPIKILPLIDTKKTCEEQQPSTSKEAADSETTEIDNDDSDSINSDGSYDENVIRRKGRIDEDITITEDTRQSRKRKRYNQLVQERTISPRREEDRIYNQIEMKRYRENKEKIRRRKEEMKRRKLLLFRQQQENGGNPINTEAADNQSILKEGDSLPIQDYLISSDEDDANKFDCDSPIIEKFGHGDKIVDELDALAKEKPLKRPLPIKDRSEYKKRFKIEERKRQDPIKSTQKTSKHKFLDSNSKHQIRKAKEKFRSEIAGIIVHHLTPYRKDSCRLGKITNNEDFKHLARKLTHFVMIKELKHCDSTGQTLVVTESVKNKSREFIKKYMAKYGEVYVRPENDPEFREIPHKE